MSHKMKDSLIIDYMNHNNINLSEIVSKLKSADIDNLLRGEIIDKLDIIIGNQEIEWIKRNPDRPLMDYVLYRYKFKFFPRLNKLDDFPMYLLVEPTSVCNLSCIMCFQSDPSFKTGEFNGFIDLGFFKHIIDQAVANNCKALTLASRGEPTLHCDFAKMLRYSKGKFYEVKINTNATRLTDELCHEICEAGVDIVVFSVDACSKEEYERIRVGGNYDIVVKNIKRFREIRDSKPEYQRTSIRISGVNLDSEKQDKDRYLAFWKEIGDDVVLSAYALRWNTYANDPINCLVPCSYLWSRMYVWHDGKCNPCDFDYKSKLIVGDAKKSLLKDIWQGEAYRRYRELFMQGKRMTLFPCKMCNVI